MITISQFSRIFQMDFWRVFAVWFHCGSTTYCGLGVRRVLGGALVGMISSRCALYSLKQSAALSQQWICISMWAVSMHLAIQCTQYIVHTKGGFNSECMYWKIFLLPKKCAKNYPGIINPVYGIDNFSIHFFFISTDFISLQILKIGFRGVL